MKNFPNTLTHAIEKLAATTNIPSPITPHHPEMNEEEKIEFIASRYREIMEVLGLDLTNDSLSKTPHRIAKMYVKEIFSGLNPETFPELTFMNDIPDIHDSSRMIFASVKFNSFCEHHFVPMLGTAHIAYVPNGKLIGLSKIPRIVRFFAKRPQVQERLTAQIADSLSIVLETESIAISIEAKHLCVIARGIEDSDSRVTTTVLRGKFESDQGFQRQFFDAIKTN